ncbi:MAG: YwiC-like family protein [Anaerolineae bacterium]|nr:YwiC-like family protein [Anaerolineae bacterium]
MVENTSYTRPQTAKAIRSVALPSEHGGWMFLLEPLLLGLAVAGSWPGLALAVAALGAFLLHQPIKVAVKDYLKGKRPLRTVWAERFMALYGLVAVAAFAVVLRGADRTFLVPLLLALPLMLTQLLYDARNQSRALLPELAGALSLGALAPAIALLDGWPLERTWPLWLLAAGRALPAILYVRARLKLDYGKPSRPGVALAAHIAVLLGGALLAFLGHAPWLAVAALLVLLARAAVGLSRYRRSVRPAVLGLEEIGYGLLTIVLMAVGIIYQL